MEQQGLFFVAATAYPLVLAEIRVKQYLELFRPFLVNFFVGDYLEVFLSPVLVIGGQESSSAVSSPLFLLDGTAPFEPHHDLV